MPTYAISDIHADLTSLQTLLALLSPTTTDTIITLGDYINRGPDSPAVIQHLINLQQTHNIITLRGNHDQLLLDTLADPANLPTFLDPYEGQTTIDSYQGSLNNIPTAHIHFLQNTILYHETKTHIFTHGGLDPNLPLNQQNPQTLLNKRAHTALPHQSQKTVICGHTRQPSTFPLNLNHTLCIDCDQHLTALQLESNTITQINRQTQQPRTQTLK